MVDCGEGLRTERINADRRGPLAVAVLAAVVVGLLLWKPWDRPSPAPSLGPIAEVPTPTSSSPLPPTPAPTAAPPPTPAATASPLPAAVEIEVGTDPRRPFVACEYRTAADGGRVLERVLVGPPIVQLNLDVDPLDVRRVAWRAEVQKNLLETLFSADWEPVVESRRQFAGNLTSNPLELSRLSIDYDQLPVGQTVVVRVIVVVEWFGPRRALLGSREIVVTTYGYDDVNVLSEGCHTTIG